MITDFTHQFLASATVDAPTLLLLHGTGGDENDLLGLGRQLLTGAHLLSPRERVSENGMPRFFRRFAEGVFDEANLRAEANALADWVADAMAQYQLDPQKIIAVGFSNGANIAAGLLLLRPDVLNGAVLLRAMTPLVPEMLPNLNGKKILLAAGTHDPIVPRNNIENLHQLLQNSGAQTTLHWESTGHGLTAADVQIAQRWLEENHGI